MEKCSSLYNKTPVPVTRNEHVMILAKAHGPAKKVNKTGARENLSRWRLPENIEIKLLFSFYKKSPNYSKYMDIAPYLVVKIIV